MDSAIRPSCNQPQYILQGRSDFYVLWGFEASNLSAKWAWYGLGLDLALNENIPIDEQFLPTKRWSGGSRTHDPPFATALIFCSNTVTFSILSCPHLCNLVTSLERFILYYSYAKSAMISFSHHAMRSVTVLYLKKWCLKPMFDFLAAHLIILPQLITYVNVLQYL